MRTPDDIEVLNSEPLLEVQKKPSERGRNLKKKNVQ
jgi:hypothetical protein